MSSSAYLNYRRTASHLYPYFTDLEIIAELSEHMRRGDENFRQDFYFQPQKCMENLAFVPKKEVVSSLKRVHQLLQKIVLNLKQSSVCSESSDML